MAQQSDTKKWEELAAKALQVMEAFAITALLIVDEERRVKGIIHMHDILKAGVV